MAATIKCPNCGEEFELTAQDKGGGDPGKKQGDQGDQQNKDQGNNDQQNGGNGGQNNQQGQQNQNGNGGNDKKKENRRVRRGKHLHETGVYACETCGDEWLEEDGSQPTTCPSCNSTNIQQVGHTNDIVAPAGVESALQRILSGADVKQVAKSLLEQDAKLPDSWKGSLATAISKIKSFLTDCGQDGAFDTFIAKLEEQGAMKASGDEVTIDVAAALKLAQESFKLKNQDGSDVPDSEAQIQSKLLKYF